MRTRAEILLDLNRDLPALDWKQGAVDYVAKFFAMYSEEQVTEFILTKPLAPVTPEDPLGAITEMAALLDNFANSIRLLSLPRGARILDVACGGGWLTHWMRKIGYDAHGIDISPDFLRLASRRLDEDHSLAPGAPSASLFHVVDLELEPLPQALRGSFDAVILESCLHHFFDPIAALSHIADGLAEGGVVLILEGENRTGPIKPEYMSVMVETSTLERPYPRALLVEALEAAGLPCVEFLGTAEGFFLTNPAYRPDMNEHFEAAGIGRNFCVCAKRPEAIQRLFPDYEKNPRGAITAAPATASASPPPTPNPLRRWLPPWLRSLLRPVWRTVRTF